MPSWPVVHPHTKRIDPSLKRKNRKTWSHQRYLHCYLAMSAFYLGFSMRNEGLKLPPKSRQGDGSGWQNWQKTEGAFWRLKEQFAGNMASWVCGGSSKKKGRFGRFGRSETVGPIRKSHKNQKSQVFLKAATWLAPLEAFAWVRVFSDLGGAMIGSIR